MNKNNYPFNSYNIGLNGDISYKTISLDVDRRDRRMTKAEMLKQIEELKKQIEALPEDENIIRTLPIKDEKYVYINGELTCDFEWNYPVSFDCYPTEENSSVGNYFKSEEDAEMVIKAMQIEQSIRIRRIELNEGWEPDWEDEDEDKYFIYSESNNFFKNYLYVSNTYSSNYLPIFGYYKSKEIAQQIIDEFNDDLRWYFKEYYPKKDKMYVWGE